MSNLEEIKFHKLAEDGAQEKTSAMSAGVKTQMEAQGTSGTEIFAGYFTEEYLNTLRGAEAANVYDKMRRSESQVAMLLSAITNPIKSACWEIEPYSQEPEHVEQAELIKCMLFDGIDFETFKHEALTMIAFGFSLFEVVHNVVFDHPEFGTFNGLQAIAFRSQKTLQAWNLEKKTGKILSVEQLVNGDLSSDKTVILLPGDFLIVFTNLKEGDNYEGISALRPMYGAYFRKALYLKLTAIGVEKYAVGTPVGTVPANKESSADFETFKKMLRDYTSHQQSYLTLSEGWKIEIQKTDFDADKIVELLKFENTEMINSVVANFLALGTNGSGGAFALSNDLSDFFASGIQSYADVITTNLNRKLIPDLVKLNFGQQEGYPKIKVTGISDKAGKELSEVIKTLIDAKAIKPDEPLEEYLRRQYKLPQPDPSTAREVTPAPAFNPAVKKFSEGNSDNAYVNALDTGKDEVKGVMKSHLGVMAQDLKKKLVSGYTSASTDAAKTAVPAKVEIDSELISKYENDLREVLAKQAVKFFAQAEKEVPTNPKKLTEIANAMKLAAPKGAGFYAALPPVVKKAVETQAALLAVSQPGDITKIVTFQFSSSATGTKDIGQIDDEVDEAVSKTLDGDSTRGMSVDAAAGNVVAHVASQAQMEHFFDPEVLAEIESFTFENNDPVSAICESLAGTTFAANDPQVDEYTPPLHHNCKSRMRANLKGLSNPEPISGKVSVSETARKSMTLAE